MLNWQLAQATAILASVSLNSSSCQSAHGREPVDTVSAAKATMVKLYNPAAHTQEDCSQWSCADRLGLRSGFTTTVDVFSSAWRDQSLSQELLEGHNKRARFGS